MFYTLYSKYDIDKGTEEPIRLSAEDRKRLCELLNQLPQWRQGQSGERSVLVAAGLPNKLIQQLAFTGMPGIDASIIIDHLENYGTLEERPNYTATGALVEYLRDNLGADKKDFLQKLIFSYNLIDNSSNPPYSANNMTGKTIMILELLTTATINAGAPFLINQLSKLTDRVNKEQLEKIQQKAQAVKTDQDVEEVKQFIQKIAPDANQIASVEAFTAWVEDTITSDFTELVGVGEITFKVLKAVRKNEKNLMKKDEIQKMENKLIGILDEFKSALRLGETDRKSKTSVYEAVTRALDFIKR